MFSGSYQSGDVEFLLKLIKMPSISVEDKENSIQKEKKHYGEMISYEKAPSIQYMNIFNEALQRNGKKLANDAYLLSKKINDDYKTKDIVLVSLARAGTPIGVIVKKMLAEYFSRSVYHYCVSIMREKGLDINALKYILANHKDCEIVFIDGWTGKGVIGQELKSSVEEFNRNNSSSVSSNLYVIADISGTAFWSATHEDYLIPCAVLNSTVSGLISRTILNTNYIAENDFHGCVYYENLKEHDISSWFVNKILSYEIDHNAKKIVDNIRSLKEKSKRTIDFFMEKHDLSSRNFVKPGVGESTRVLLRRLPKVIYVKNLHDPQLEHLIYLAQQKFIQVEEINNLAYNAIAIIEELD